MFGQKRDYSQYISHKKFFTTKKKKFLTISFSLLTICAVIFATYNTNRAQGVDFIFAQTDWNGGQTTNTANHTSNQSGWAQYGAKGINLMTNSNLSLTGTNSAVFKTTNADFAPGTFTGVAISGTGESASLQLQNQNVIDSGTGADGAYSCPSGTCNLAGGTYNYTTFTIAYGATVNVTGTSPLTLKVTDSVNIAGVLNLRGNNGQTSGSTAGGEGGVAKSGGYAGGNGGSGNSAGSPGSGPFAGAGGARRVNNSGGIGGAGGGAI